MRLKRISLLLPIAGALLFAAPAGASQVYVTGSTGHAISPFSIGANGSLSPISCPGSNCNSASQPLGVAISPNGQYLYAANHGSSRVTPFTIGANGSLTPISCPGSNCNTGTNPYGIAVSPGGQFVYTTNLGTDSVSAFSVGANGSLTPISCPGSNCNTGVDPYGVVVTPNGQRLYTANRESGTISAFSIGANGSLTPISCPGSSCNAGTWPQALAVSPNGQFLYTANRNSARVSIFSINANGTLTPVGCPGSNCNTGLSPMSMAIAANGQRLYTVNRNGQNVSAFSINANGTLTPIACPGSNCSTGPIPGGIALSPDSKYVYASNFGSSTVSPFSIGANGSLALIGCPGSSCNTAAGPDFQSVVASPIQAPVASFAATVEGPVEVSFDGSGSVASPGQTVARYDWAFGDGHTAPDAGPTPSHVYDAEGEYTVTLTITDNAGCSTTLTYTGQTASCNGSLAATAAETVSVGDPPGVIIDSPGFRVTDDTTPTFSFHSTEPNSTFECSIDSGTPSFGPCSGPGASHTPPAALGIGFYAFRVRATDQYGNTGLPAIEMFRVDPSPELPEPGICPGVSAAAARSGRPPKARARAAHRRKRLGVRASIAVDQPSQLRIRARLRWRRDGKWRITNLGSVSLPNQGVQDLRLALPKRLARRMDRGTRVKLLLRVAAYPVSSPGCTDPAVERLSLRTRVAMVRDGR